MHAPLLLKKKELKNPSLPPNATHMLLSYTSEGITFHFPSYMDITIFSSCCVTLSIFNSSASSLRSALASNSSSLLLTVALTFLYHDVFRPGHLARYLMLIRHSLMQSATPRYRGKFHVKSSVPAENMHRYFFHILPIVGPGSGVSPETICTVLHYSLSRTRNSSYLFTPSR
eukprot:SAG11_NODE_1295_length_5275_cov_3.069165_2_plen_172_part_00